MPSRSCSRGTSDPPRPDLAVPLALVGQLPAQLAERHIMDRAGVYPPTQPLDVQVLDTDQIEVSHQTRSKRVQGGLTLLPHVRMRPCYPQPLLLTPPTAFLPSGKTPLLLTQVSEAGAAALWVRDLLPPPERPQIPQSQIHPPHAVGVGGHRRLHL